MNRSRNGSDAIMLEVARRIRLLREQQELSQQDLAEACGLSRNTLSLLERGLTSPRLTTLQKIANALKVDVGAFIQRGSRSTVAGHQSGVDGHATLSTSVKSKDDACRIDSLISAHLLRLESGACSGYESSHQGEEVVYCLSGECLCTVDKHSYLLRTGDSMLFDGRLPHGFQNPGHKTTKALVILLDVIH